MSQKLNDFLETLSKSPLTLAANGQLKADIWQMAGIPLGDGKFWMYQDNNAIVKAANDNVDIEIPQFSAHNDQVQILDNPKQLYLTNSAYEPGQAGIIAFSCQMGAEIFKADTKDYRDGFCAFNVLDFASAMVFDIVSNGTRVWAIYERLFIPGATTEKEAFTEVIPLVYTVRPNKAVVCTVVYNRQTDKTDYYLDQKLVFTADSIPVKVDRLQTGFGIITLHPIANGKSVSCRGQGGRGNWSDFAVYRG